MKKINIYYFSYIIKNIISVKMNLEITIFPHAFFNAKQKLSKAKMESSISSQNSNEIKRCYK